MNLPQLLILGTAGFAREVAQLAYELNEQQLRWTSIGFVAADSKEVGKSLGRFEIVSHDDAVLEGNFSAEIVLGIGRPNIRAKDASIFESQNERFIFPNLIHPDTTLDHKANSLGYGNIVTAGCRFTCDITVGNFNVFNLNTTVGHDTIIGHYNVFNPGVNLSGFSDLQDAILVGTGAQLLEHTAVGTGATIGAGAVVTKAVAPGHTVVGVPARPLQK